MLILCFMVMIFLAPTKYGWSTDSDARSAQQLYTEGIEHLKNGEEEVGIELLRLAVEKDDKLTQAWNALGLAYMGRDGYQEDALNAFLRSLELMPNQAEVFASLGMIYSSRDQDIALCEEYFSKAIALDPDSVRANFGLGWLFLWKKNDLKKAALAFKKVLNSEPNNALAEYGLGMAYLGQDNKAMALKSISALRFLRRDDLAVALEALMQPKTESENSSSASQLNALPENSTFGDF